MGKIVSCLPGTGFGSALYEVDKQKQDRKDADAKAAYKDRVTKGVRFYDKKGKGHIRDGKKVYS